MTHVHALVYITGYGRKFSGARGQPLTRGPEADETKTMTVTLPHHARVSLSKQRQHRSARSTCAAAPNELRASIV